MQSVNTNLAAMSIPSQSHKELVGKLADPGTGVKESLAIMASAMAFFKVGGGTSVHQRGNMGVCVSASSHTALHVFACRGGEGQPQN